MKKTDGVAVKHKEDYRKRVSKARTAACICLFLALALLVAFACTLNVVREDGKYYTKQSIAPYIYKFKELPSNFLNKADIDNVPIGERPYYNVGGNEFRNDEGRIPNPDGVKMTECDVYSGVHSSLDRGEERIVFLNDGSAVYYTDDHYESFTLITRWSANSVAYVLLICAGGAAIGYTLSVIIMRAKNRKVGEEAVLSLQIVVVSVLIIGLFPVTIVLWIAESIVEAARARAAKRNAAD